MRCDVRIYGDFHGIPQEIFTQLEGHIPFEQVKYDGKVLRVDHEGQFMDVDDFLDHVAALLPAGAWGALDYIDNLDWVVTRYTIKDGIITAKKIPLNNVLDAHQHENGL